MDYREIINSKFSEPAAILTYKDETFRIAEINDKFIPELWMNITKEEFLSAKLSRCFDDDNMWIMLNAVKKCVRTGEEQVVETWRMVFSDCCGYDRICLRSRLVLVEKTDDQAIVYEGITNITNEKVANDTLSDVEYRYKMASEQINIYNWEYTIATKEMRPCYRCMRDLGLPAVVENYPEPPIEAGIFPPDYADMYREFMRKIDAGAPELEVDIPLTVGRVPFRIKYTTEFDENGKPVKAFASATLISETELGHIKLDNQIISSLAEEYSGIYLADFVKDEVKIVKQAEAFSVKEGANCSDLMKTTAEKLNDISTEQKKMLCDINAVRNHLFTDSDLREFVYKDDTDNKWIRVDYHAVERTGDKVDRLLITVSVVDDLRAQKMDADRLIAFQKAELEDRQHMLLDAMKEADRANRAKTAFFSNMSHDIRTPMSAITGFSRLALDDIDDRDQLKDYLDKIVSAGDHLMTLINDILDMSRIESGKMDISPSPLRLKDVLNECADMVRVKMDENKLNFNVDVDNLGDDVVECDKLRLSQVILNLLSNAYKFTPEGGSVSLTGKLKEKKDMYTYEIRVKDTGIGMSEEFSKQIWEAYSRDNSGRVHETQGTGLGMFIVNNIVTMMQGTIKLDTAPGKGSEFTIELPLKPSSAAVSEQTVDSSVTDALNRDYSGVTVLVVDDTPTNLKLAERVLEKYGFTVKTASDGINALETVKESKPGDIDIILMDVLMPVMDGLEATRRIRALEDSKLASIPIIAMTANAFAADVQEALDAGMNAHVPKPFRKEELITCISNTIAG